MLAYALMLDPPPSGAATAGARLDRLVEIMRALRAPGGCPWDREQTLASLRPFVIEEAYEVVDAIDRTDLPALRDELGDLVFEAVFLAQLCAEDGRFTLADALDAAAAKLIRRHPHVFGDDAASDTMTSDDVKRRWEQIKAAERAAAGQPPSLLDSIPAALPGAAPRLSDRPADRHRRLRLGPPGCRAGQGARGAVGGRGSRAAGGAGRRRGRAGRPAVLRSQPRPPSRRGARRGAPAARIGNSPGVSPPSNSTFALPAGRCGMCRPTRWIGPGTASSRPNGPETHRTRPVTANRLRCPPSGRVSACRRNRSRSLPTDRFRAAPYLPVHSCATPPGADARSGCPGRR